MSLQFAADLEELRKRIEALEAQHQALDEGMKGQLAARDAAISELDRRLTEQGRVGYEEEFPLVIPPIPPDIAAERDAGAAKSKAKKAKDG